MIDYVKRFIGNVPSKNKSMYALDATSTVSFGNGYTCYFEVKNKIFPEFSDKQVDNLYYIYCKLKDKVWFKDFEAIGCKDLKAIVFGKQPEKYYHIATFGEFVDCIKEKEEENRKEVMDLLRNVSKE